MSILTIPPGAGKTTEASRVHATAIEEGMIGVTAARISIL